MSDQILQQLITGAPNFIGLIIAVFVLFRRLAAQDKLIDNLVQKWANCEDSEEKKEMMDVSH